MVQTSLASLSADASAQFAAGYLYGLAPTPSPPEPTPEPEPSKRDPQTPGYFISGWYYGVTNETKMDDILGCYKESEDLTNTLYDAMEAYIAGD